jgi:hypothetical protein
MTINYLAAMLSKFGSLINERSGTVKLTRV